MVDFILCPPQSFLFPRLELPMTHNDSTRVSGCTGETQLPFSNPEGAGIACVSIVEWMPKIPFVCQKATKTASPPHPQSLQHSLRLSQGKDL